MCLPVQVIEDTKRIQADTLVALGTQGQQLDAIGQDLTRVGDLVVQTVWQHGIESVQQHCL